MLGLHLHLGALEAQVGGFRSIGASQTTEFAVRYTSPMAETDQTALLAAARAGDHDAFSALVDPLRRELFAHCYRLLGSAEDAEDALQETLIRAWRRFETFEGRAPLRAWLYKIATNSALEFREQRHRRSLPSLLAAAADPSQGLGPPVTEPVWLEPALDSMLGPHSPGPEALYDARESISLAFLAALQHLPGRQRAVLILRDVLGWRAAEVAELLSSSEAAVNSSLQRARETTKSLKSSWGVEPPPQPVDRATETLLHNYVRAWETADVGGLVSLLRTDAVLAMPPFAAWFQGREAIDAFLRAVVFPDGSAGAFRLLPIAANRAPGFAVYQRGAEGGFQPNAIVVLELSAGAIAECHHFLSFDGRLFDRFGLPASL
jgi:RNA polymerase sigma-70 factor, ECF subfamily